MKKIISALLILLIGLFTQSGLVFAAPQNADVSVDLQGPSTSPISNPTTYTVVVKNNGPSTSNGIILTLEFPLTNTSPTVHVLGTVSNVVGAGCSRANNKLTCAVGSLNKNKSKTYTYQYTPPVSTKVLELKAKVTATTNDNNSANNNDSFVPNLTYPARSFASATMLNSHCAGQSLTSYFECLLYPSSISSHGSVFNADGSITIPWEADYTGAWIQPASHKLNFVYYGPTWLEAVFTWFAINGANCFDGLTSFPGSQYLAPYHVCIQ